MQKESHLKFNCTNCGQGIPFSLGDLEMQGHMMDCPDCLQHYSFQDVALIRQIKKFSSLCLQIKESEEILSQTSVGIDIKEHHVKIPYKLLLTRLNALLELKVGDRSVSIEFRMEPLLKGELCQPQRPH